ncbi:MAG: 16S rRNA (uracil(1498)-N(3))-methyltransferase [Lentimicrobium sp.]|nr:16S rRNA (uracil(1498)-N(3))-methyltransferase [Lentimicrobium sp.]
MQSFKSGDFIHLLSEVESIHIKVMRLKPGDQIKLTDGLGNFADASLEDVNPKKSKIRLLNVMEVPERSGKLVIAVAPTKNISRYEWLVEKATEIGVDEIIPLYCDHSERERLRVDRLEKVAISAIKQSLKAKLPKIHEPISFNNLMQSQVLPNSLFMAWIDEDVTLHLKNVYQKGADTMILIGPEGDFSASEVFKAKERGFTPVSLGKARLRTETAALFACMIVNLINE